MISEEHIFGFYIVDPKLEGDKIQQAGNYFPGPNLEPMFEL